MDGLGLMVPDSNYATKYVHFIAIQLPRVPI